MMVDFAKHLQTTRGPKPIDPLELYETLDRAHDKGPLRPSQSSVLHEWHENGRRRQRDLVLKMHTGQGKTLIGLLMLQSLQNELSEPVLYVCPNNYLVEQTAEQARQFGVKVLTIGGGGEDLPGAFQDGEAILICSVQKLFNGKTKFGLAENSISAGAIVLDDAHACIDSIENTFRIEVAKDEQPYQFLLELFGSALERQGAGTYAEIKRGLPGSFLPVPYWEWQKHHAQIADVLAGSMRINSVGFGWPLLKDNLADCLCLISGSKAVIVPYHPPLHYFGTFANAKRRIFMSATIAEDSFLVKGLGVQREAVSAPLTDNSLSWSGEKMVIIPSLIDETLDRSEMVKNLGPPLKNRAGGVVVLVPSFHRTEDWKQYGADVATTDSLSGYLEGLRRRNFETPLVLANRYDGIDLPDDSCRLLVLDSRPFAEDLLARYISRCRRDSAVIHLQTARKIEQGMGRAVRGEKDYCAVLLIGPDLVRAVKTQDRQAFFSGQTRMQIKIGLEVARHAKADVEKGVEPADAVKSLATQLLGRDPAWKEFYQQYMDTIENQTFTDDRALNLFSAEFKAEIFASKREYAKAAETIQKLIDSDNFDRDETGWYLQEMARYYSRADKVKSQELQAQAYKANHSLLAPDEPVALSKLQLISQNRVENIQTWMGSHPNHAELMIKLNDILSSLVFGANSDAFEQAFNDLAVALGFVGQRPDHELKLGPDNLWALPNGEFLLVECKNEVLEHRKAIYKDETGQMNNSTAWFADRYKNSQSTNIMIIPTRTLGPGAGFNVRVEIMTRSELSTLCYNVRALFRGFSDCALDDISPKVVSEALAVHKLTVSHLKETYSKPPRVSKL